MNQINDNTTDSNNFQEENTLINYERIWYRVLRYWYLVVGSLLITLSIAFVYNRYATKIYPLAASIIIKESEEAGQTAELLYNNPLINAYRNFLNEPYIIRSFPLVQQVVDSLGLTVVIYGEGNIKTTELYKQLPIKITGNKQNGRYLNAKFDFIISNKNEFKLLRDPETVKEDDELKMEFGGHFNDTLLVDGFFLVFNSFELNSEEIDRNYVLIFKDGFNVAMQYSSKLKVEWAEEGASVIDLSLNTTIPSKEIDFLKVLIQFYSIQDENKKKAAALNSKLFIDKQLQIISDSLLLIEKQLESFKDKNALSNLDETARSVILKMDELEKDKTSYIIKDSYYKYLISYFKNTKNLDQIVLPTAVGVEDPVLVSLISQMVNLQMKLKIINSTTTQENPLVKGNEQRIQDLRDGILESVKNLKATDKIVVDQIKSQLRLLESQLAGLPKAERQLVTIQRTYKLGENLYVFLTQKRTEAAISEASTVSDVITVNQPYLSGGIISPKSRLNYMIALFFGIGIPLAFFVIKELFNSKIQSKEDIERISKIPIIGVIGHNEEQDRMVVSNKPKSSLAEAFRSLRSNLNYFIKREKFTLMLTSSISGEGKSFTTLNLANIFALSGKKTVIVGADMRKPRIFQELNLDNTIGLSNYLSSQTSLNKIIQETRIENLSVISSGPVPPNPGELILRQEFSVLLNLLKEEFNIILIDTPPIGIVADALEVASQVDHTLFITRQNYTPLEAIASVDQQVKQGKLSNMSFVFNDIYKFGPGYGYGYGYGYGQKKGGGYYED